MDANEVVTNPITGLRSKQVGPYVVNELNVEDGLTLMSTSTEDGTLQRELVMRCTTLDGKPVSKTPFSTLLKHMSDLASAAVEVNGFSGDDTKSE